MSTTAFIRRAVGPLVLLVGLTRVAPLAAQTLETETLRLPARFGLNVGSNFEYQTSTDGRETAMPFIVEFGLTRSTELVVEPVPYTAIRPRTGRRATGAGDLEITVIQQLIAETPSRPAFGLAGEVKVPTAHDPLIGTGKTDFAAYLIGSKRFGRLDGHLNVGYTVVGRPVGVTLNNIANFAAGFVYDVSERTKLFGEVLGNTAASVGAPEGSATPEVAGGELVGTVGIGRKIADRFFLTTGLSYDNNGALLLRPGFMVRIR